MNQICNQVVRPRKPLILLMILPTAYPSGRWWGAIGAIILSKTHQTGPLAARFDRNPLGRDLIVGDVHADVPGSSWPAFVEALENPALSNSARERLIDQAQWSRDRIDKLFRDDVAGVRAVVVGHTPVERLTSLGNVHYIDTAAWKGGNANPALFPLLDAHTLRPAEPPSALRW